MAGETPSRKRRFGRLKPSETHQGGTGPSGAPEPLGEHSAALLPHAVGEGGRGPSASPDALPVPSQPPAADAAAEQVPEKAGRLAGMRRGVRRSGQSARAAVGYLADRIIENAPRIPVRDLATLRSQFPGLDPEQLADKLVAGAANGTATVGAGVGAAAMLPVPPAMPAELAAEITGVAAIELKLIAELYEVYGQRPPGTLKERSAVYLTTWSEERGIDVTKPSTYKNAALVSSGLKRELRQQIMKRMIRNLPNLLPFMIGAAVGAVINRRDTRQLAERIRKDLRVRRVSWDALELPPLEQPQQPLELSPEPGHRAHELER
ncbi:MULTISPECIES: hypothetical protein [Streptomyces]|uniref:EcsC family protein n=1 Tax=Streptomyces tsukubensis (strain DSM 42081 / NBRC 108919 / NRRL 18488 / 9993) TaxID=1114943 RepID=A0A7G3UD06_STRT9|nr:hypothetical protein [Streptomyces tsukubensis]AZK97127.1 hypothetical protein B7R87_27100 [Streptomyces tsukubensis]MYS67471.1 hypothetical protein [Streptomyces sp. SID5473]QKM66902.1 hypothetical protein STSU_006665 [Streptomyces tsukubensis NRRL18488]TAI44751.1 hypothetical protein EWI31_05565 [Streptomyces tsukubensis]